MWRLDYGPTTEIAKNEDMQGKVKDFRKWY